MSSDVPAFRIVASPGFTEWLRRNDISLALSTYQLGKLFLIGQKPTGELAVFERTFDRCLGLWSDGQTIWLASAFQLWRLENVLEAGNVLPDGIDRLYVPRVAITTGDLDVHDLSVDGQGELMFANTLFNCLGRTSPRWNFELLWKPPFITRLAATDACHLNGLATIEGEPAYVTCCGTSETAHGWRDNRESGGVVIDVRSNEIITHGLSMPHSPRWHDERLWILNSGRGELLRIDRQTGRGESIASCAGYARGLTFVGHYAIVGLSRPRHETFAGLPLDDVLARRHVRPECGLMVVDLVTGKVVEWLRIEGRVDELYDVVVLPHVARPKALGLKTDEIRRNAWVHDGERVAHWIAGSG